MSENENKVCPVSCKIEHHAMMFAFLAKHAIELCGEAGKDAILAGMTTYGNERGARMAANALAHGDELTAAYGIAPSVINASPITKFIGASFLAFSYSDFTALKFASNGFFSKSFSLKPG